MIRTTGLSGRTALLGLALTLAVPAASAGVAGCGGVVQITSSQTARFSVGAEGDFKIAASSKQVKISESGQLPYGLTFSDKGNGTAAISGTPASGTGGQYPITLSASGSAGQASQRAVLTVDEVPYFTSSDTIWGVIFKYDRSPITAKGYPLPTISESGTLPRGMSFRTEGNGKAVIYGTPEFSFGAIGPSVIHGPAITLTAANSAGSTNQTVQINITGGGS